VDGDGDGIIHDEIYSFKTSILNRLSSVDGIILKWMGMGMGSFMMKFIVSRLLYVID